MTELPIEKAMLLSKVEGRVFVLRVDGTLEYGEVGSELHLGDLLLGGRDAIFQLTEKSFVAAEAHQGVKVRNVIGSIAVDDFDNGSLDVLRKLISDGGDPTELFSPSTSGTNTIAEMHTPKDPSSSQGDFVVIQRSNGSTLADASFDTEYRDNADNAPHLVAKSEVFYSGYINSNEAIPPSFEIPAIHLTEDAFTNDTAVIGESSFVVKLNNAPLSVESLVFSNQGQTLVTLNGAALGSDGHPLTFEFADDRSLLGYYLDGNGQRVEVLRAELVAEQEGSDVVGRVVIALTGPLDHQGSDNIFLGLQVSASEIDGDATSANLKIAINDGRDPALGSDQGVALQEGIHHSAEGQLPVTVGSDRLVSLNFEPNQPALAGLTSQGKATTYEVHDNQLIVKDWQGEAILTVTIGLDGKYSVSLTGDFDEPVDTARLDLALHVEGRDLDGDKSNQGTLNITITDAPQMIAPVSLILTEDSDWQQGQTLSGALVVPATSDSLVSITFDATQPDMQGFTSGQQAVAITVADHLIEGRTPDGKLVFELILGDDGNYSFTLHQPLDQVVSDSILNSHFTALFASGAEASSTYSVTIVDGVDPGISYAEVRMASVGTGIVEISLGEEPATTIQSFGVIHGSDALDPNSLSFDIAAISRALIGLSSHGSAVSFSLEPNGHLIGVSTDGRIILRAELSMVADVDGNWEVTTQVTLSGELDHVGGERLSLPLAITFSDMDGDQSSFSVPFYIADGALPVVIAGSGSGVFFSEDGLSPVAPKTATGSFIVRVGSDRLAEVSFADRALQPALSAQGKPIQYELADGDPALPGSQLLKGYVMIDGHRVEVFEIQLSGSLDQTGLSQFSYQCTLFTGMDQDASRVLSLPLVVNIHDYDHAGSSTTGILEITITGDELPIVNMSLETLTEGRFDGVSDSNDDQIVKGALTISTMADPVVQVQLFMSGELVNLDYTPLTHNGEAITWQPVGTTGHLFQGVTASGVVVVTVELLNVPTRIESNTTQTLEYQVTLHTNVDHIGGFDYVTQVPISVEVRDSDGNGWVRNTYINILDGRNPVITSVESVTVNEAALDGGAGQHPGTHAADTGEIATGQIMMAAGSDRVASIEIDVAEFNKINVFSSTPPDGFRAGGVKLVALAEPGHYMGFADTFPAGPNGSAIGPSYPRPLFYVKLDVTGHYTFTLVGSLSHTNSDAGNGEQLSVKLPLFVTDHDGDRSDIKVVNVTVLDDAPLGTNVEHTLVEGGAQISGSLLPFLGADGTMAGRGMIATKLTINNVNYGFGVEIAVPSSDGGQVMGTLVVNRDGSYRFTPSSSLTHNDSQVIKVRLLDGDQDAVDTMITLNVQDKQGLLLEHHSILALADTQIPLPLDASVMNGMPGELSLRVDGLKGAEVVDVSGNSIGHEIVGGEWLLPIDHNIPLYINGLGDGAQKLTLYMESSIDSYVQASANDELDIYVGGMKEISGTQGNELLLGDNYGNVLKGGAGDDLLIGGGGSDLFLWSQEDDGEVNAPAHDIIKDFNISEDDIIDVADLLSGVKGTSVDELLNFVDMKVSDADGGLKNINMAISPLGDGKITQQISLSNVDISMFAGSSESEILKALVDDQNLRFI